MNAICETVNSMGTRFVDFALPMLVQSSALILILLFADFLLRKKVRAVFRYWIWMTVLLKLVLPTSLSSPISLGRWFGDELAYMTVSERNAEPEVNVEPPVPPLVSPIESLPPVEPSLSAPVMSPPMQDTAVQVAEPKVEPAEIEPIASPPTPITFLSWQGILFVLWLIIAAAMGLLLLQRAVFVRSFIAQAQETEDPLIRTLVNCAIHMRVRGKISLKVSMNATSPAVCGLFRPVILVPDNLASSLDPRQLHIVLLHELAHIKRGDLWVNLAQTLLQILYFYNPLLWLANAIIRRAREQAVDETVLVSMGEYAGQYPQTLMDVAKLAFERPALSLRLIGVVESKGALSGRIKRILSRPIPKTAKLGLIGMASLFIASAVLLPMAKARSNKLNKIAWYDRKTLIKFESKGKPNGTTHTEGDTKVYSKNYDVVFRKGEGLLVFAELYETGKPMRRLGHKIFPGSVEPQRLSTSLIEKIGKQGMDGNLQNINYQIYVQLGDERLEISTDIPTPIDASGGSWGWFQDDTISSHKIENKIPACRLFTLLRYFRDTKKSDEEFRIWVPNCHIGEVGKDKQIIVVRMVPLSRLNYRIDDLGPMVGDQLPDGSILQANIEKPHKIRDQYLQSVKALTIPLSKVTAHKYYKVGEPIKVKLTQMVGGWKPGLEDIYVDDDHNPIFVVINGQEYGSTRGVGPFGWGTQWLTASGMTYGNVDFPPGKYRFAYGWKGLDVIDPDRPDEAIHFDRLMTNEVEFEVVEEIPADYYREVYQEGWEDILRRSIGTPFTDDMRQYGVYGLLFALSLESLPFDIAFEIYAQAEGSEERQYAGRVARQANSGRYLMGCDPYVKDLIWDTVGQKRWRLILVPSKKVAMAHPPIHHYYGREFVTDWATFVKSNRFERNRRSHLRSQQRENRPDRGGSIKADRPVDLDRLGRRLYGHANEAWPLPDGFELGWSNENGGTLRIDPQSDVRMLWFPEANANLIESTAETRRRLVELPDSKLTEINPPKAERTLIAVRSSEGKSYFVRVSKVNETWANLSWWPARGVGDGPFGRVVDKTGRGVRDATLVFHKKVPTEEKFQKITVTSDVTGAFILPKIEPGKSMGVRISAPGFEELESVNVEHHTDGTYIPANLIFPLHRLGTISGSVIGPDGKPLAGAPLSLSTSVRYPDFGQSIFTTNQLRAISDNLGGFVLRDVPPGTHLLFYPWKGPSTEEVEDGTWRAFQKPGERWPSAPVKGVFGAAVIEVGDGQKVRDVVIDLSQSTCTVEGRVSDSAGRPVSGAKVCLYWKIHGSLSSVAGKEYEPVVTDSQGGYRLANLPPGNWHIRAWHDRVAMHSDAVPVSLTQNQAIRYDLTLGGFIEENDERNEDVFIDIEPRSSSEQANKGLYRWGVTPPEGYVLEHGWFSLIDGQVKEHVGGGRDLGGTKKLTEVVLETSIEEDLLNLKIQQHYQRLNGKAVSAVTGRTQVPSGSKLEVEYLSRYRRMTNTEYRSLWEGRFVLDGQTLKTVVYCARIVKMDEEAAYFHPNPAGEELDADLGVPRTRVLIDTSRKRSLQYDEVSGTGRENDLQADFESLSVEISGIWRWWQKSRFRVMGDGLVEFSMSKAPNNPERYKSTFNLKRKDLARLNQLLEETGWLTKPGANVEPGYTDASRIEMTLSRHGMIRNAWCHDRNPEPYGALVKFIEQLYRQEDLLKRMSGDKEPEKLSAAYQIQDELKSMRGEPVAAGPVRILDYHRFVPVCTEILSNTDAHHRETIRAALWLLAYVREESQRDLITELTTAKQTSSEPQFSQAKTEYTQIAALNALVALGGDKSIRHIRTLAKEHAERKVWVNNAIVEALFELDGLNSIDLLKSMLRTTPSAGWALIRLGGPAIPAIVEVLEDTPPKPLESMGQIYLIRQYIDNWENAPKPIDERVIAAVRANLDYRLGYSSDWTNYHQELLRLANVSEPEYRNSRQIAEQFLLAVKNGNDELLTRIAQVKSDWRDRLVSLRQLPDLEKLEIVEVYTDQTENVAWAVCFDINNLSSYDHYVFIILNFLSGKVWRVVNISIEDTPAPAERLYRRLLEKYPDTGIVPNTAQVEHKAHSEVGSNVKTLTYDNLFDVARAANYKVGPEWFRVAESSDKDIYLWARIYTEQPGEPGFNQVLDDWMRWKYKLDKVVDTDSAKALFKSFCDQFDREQKFDNQDPRARAIGLICDKLDTNELIDRYIEALRSGRSFASSVSDRNVDFSIDDIAITGHERGDVLPASLSAVWHALRRIDEKLDKRFPSSRNIIEDRLTPILIQEYERRNYPRRLDQAVLLGGPAIAEYLLAKDWQAPPDSHNYEFGVSPLVNKWLLRLMNLDDPAGEKFRSEHPDLVPKFADMWTESFETMFECKPPRFIFFDKDKGRQSFAWRYRPTYSAKMNRIGYLNKRIELKFEYLMLLEPYTTTQMYFDCWIQMLDEPGNNTLYPQNAMRNVPVPRKRPLATMLLENIRERQEKIGSRTKENREVWSQLNWHNIYLTGLLNEESTSGDETTNKKPDPQIDGNGISAQENNATSRTDTNRVPSVSSLIRTLKIETRSHERARAANALGDFGLNARAAIPDLILALGDEDEFVRESAAEAIGEIDPTDLRAVPTLIEAMKDESGRFRVAVAQTLLKIGPVNKDVILAFIDATDDNWKGVIYACDEFFPCLGSQHSEVVPELIDMLKKPDGRVRALACRALGNMGEAAIPAVPYIVENINNQYSSSRSGLEVYASGALSRLGPHAVAAVPQLIEMLKDKHKRFSAALALEGIGPAAREAIPALESCLEQSHFIVFPRVLLAIEPNSSKAIEALVKISESPYVPDQWTEQPDAHYLLIQRGYNKTEHLEKLIAALENPNSGIRLSATSYLGKLGTQAHEAFAPLVKALQDDDPRVRAGAAHAILLIGVEQQKRKGACAILMDLLDGKDFAGHDGLFMAQVRVAEALSSFGPSEGWAVPRLIMKLHDRSTRTRIAVIKALGNIGPGAKEALPHLEYILKDENYQIRLFTKQAIQKINSKPV